MAQLKDLIVNGATQLIGDAVASNLKVTTVVAPAAANSATYGMGTNGQVLHSTSSSVYWGDTVDAVTIVPSFTTGQKIADITIDGATTSIYAPEGTVQVNANWTATTGVASILNKPSIPSTYTDVGAASAGHTHTYSAVGAASAAHTHTYSDVGAASAGHTHTAANVGAVPTSRTVNGKSLNSNITLTAADVGALPTTTVIPAAQVNSDWNATTGVSSILNKPSIPAAQVNANWTATTGVASILNKPSIPSTYSDVGASSAAHTHTYSQVGAASAAHTHTYSDVGASSAAHAHGNITSGGDITSNATIANGDRLVINDESASKIINSSITFGTSTTSFLANNGTWQTPAGTAQVNANWTATTGVASILNKPAIPSTYTDVGAASSGHTHTYSAVGAASAAHTHTYSAVGAASAAHVHGSITSDGKITATGVTIANGDGLVIVDSSDNSKIKKSSITFGTSTTSFLANDGTWQTVDAAPMVLTVGDSTVSFATAKAALDAHKSVSAWSTQYSTFLYVTSYDSYSISFSVVHVADDDVHYGYYAYYYSDNTWDIDDKDLSIYATASFSSGTKIGEIWSRGANCEFYIPKTNIVLDYNVTLSYEPSELVNIFNAGTSNIYVKYEYNQDEYILAPMVDYYMNDSDVELSFGSYTAGGLFSFYYTSDGVEEDWSMDWHFISNSAPSSQNDSTIPTAGAVYKLVIGAMRSSY